MEVHGVSSGRSKESTALTGVLVGFVDVLVTLAALLAADSAVLLADTMKTTLEFVAVLLAWLAIRRISRGADHHFNYGVGKLENLSSLLIGLLMVCCVLIISADVVHSLIKPSHISGIGVWISLTAQIVYGVINGAVFMRARRMSKTTSSPLMVSQARLFFSRFVGNIFIFVSLSSSLALSSHPWSMYIDPIASMLIAMSIIMSATCIFSSSFYDLLDRTLEETDQLAILREVAKHFDEYKDLHGIRSRRSGSRIFIDIFLEFEKDKTMAEVQQVVSNLRTRIEGEIPDSHVTIGLTDRREC